MAIVNLGRVVGKSAYEVWLDAGNTGTEADYLESLKGEVTQAQMNTAISDAITPVTSQLADITEEIYNQYALSSKYSDNYWRIVTSGNQLVAGTRYRIVFTVSTGFTLDVIQIGTDGNNVSMVDTIATNVTLSASSPYSVYYTPSVSGLAFIRTLAHANDVVSIIFYTISNVPKGTTLTRQAEADLDSRVSALENDTDPITDEGVNYYAQKINLALSETRELKHLVDDSITSMLKLHGEAAEFTATIPSVGTHDKAYVRVGLHYGPELYTHRGDEIYFDSGCEKDFSDIRFFDAGGNILKAEFGPLVNMELAADSNLDNVKKVMPSGKLVGYREDQGLLVSADGGSTWTAISGTYNVTTHGSSVYNRKSMYPVFVDSDENIFAYAGGVLYKLMAGDSYVTKTPVLDFTWVNSSSVTIYPDILNHAFDEDTNGNMVLGIYQSTSYYHTDIYASSDGGSTWALSWHNYDGEYQHVHHVHADKYSNKIYVGIDDDGSHQTGGHILVTEDGGATWEEITGDFTIRGKDYYPTYFGNGYRLGGGETFLMGSATVYRSIDDATLIPVVRGVGGVRSFADFGDDDIIVCGQSASSFVAENRIYVSNDKGQTWKSIFKKYQNVYASSGIGFRDIHNAVQLGGDTEPCIVLPKDTGFVPSFRIYQGGDHWYREAYIMIEGTGESDIEITAKTGYSVAYPYSCLEGNEHDGLVYEVPLNEGAGNYVKDSFGVLIPIVGTFKWENDDEPVRFGDHGATPLKPFLPSSALLLNPGASLNLGKIDTLNFSDNFTITLWFNTKAKYLTPTGWEDKLNVRHLFSFGDVFMCINQNRWWMCNGNGTNFDNHSGMKLSTGNSYDFTNDYYHLAIVVQNGVCSVYVNGQIGNIRSDEGTFLINSNISESDFIIAPKSTREFGYISDLKIYNRAMAASEILELYRGW